MAKIVITGSQGFVGKHLVNKLRKLGHKVYELDMRYEPDPIDLTSLVDTKRHFEEITSHRTKPIDVVFDLATLPLPNSLKYPYMVPYKIFCMGSVMCELLREGYYKKLLHISSSEVYNLQTPYAAGKASQDNLIYSFVKSFNLNAVIARPFNTYGPGQVHGAVIPNTIERILNGKQPIISGDGTQTRDLIYVDDTVDGMIDVWKKGETGHSYDITTSEEWSVNEIVALISIIMGVKVNPEYIPSRSGDPEQIHGISDILLKPKVTFEEGLRRTIEWWIKNYS